MEKSKNIQNLVKDYIHLTYHPEIFSELLDIIDNITDPEIARDLITVVPSCEGILIHHLNAKLENLEKTSNDCNTCNHRT